MATRQYIGARYVPTFYNNPNGGYGWQAGVAYEALTMVQYGSSVYISKQPVPASVGRPNEAGNYWVVTSFGGQEAVINQIQKDITALQEDVSQNTKDIEEISVKTNTKRKYIVIMDSWGDSLFNGGFDTINAIRAYLGVEPEYFFGRGHAGGGFAPHELGNNFINDLNYLSTRVGDVNLVTDIYVFAGANDYSYSEEDIQAGLRSFIGTANEKYPNASVKIGFVSNTISGGEVDNTAKVVTNYMKCTNYGAIYLNNSEYIFRRYKDYDKTLTHPNLAGSQYLAMQLARLMKTDSIDVVRQYNYDITVSAGVELTSAYKSGIMVQHNGNVTYYGGAFNGYILRATFNPELTEHIFDWTFNISDSFVFTGSVYKPLNSIIILGNTTGSIATSGEINFMPINRPYDEGQGVPIKVRGMVAENSGNIKYLDIFSNGSVNVF